MRSLSLPSPIWTLSGCLLLSLLTWSPRPVSGVDLTSFYPFGTLEDDVVMSPGDETSSDEISLEENFVLYNQSFKTAYVNTNGHVSFDSEVPSYRAHIAMPLGTFIVAPFYADIDTRGSGRVYYRNTSDQALLQRAAAGVQINFAGYQDFMPKSLFIATWDRVGYYPEKADKVNTFQVVLATDGMDTFAYFHYLDNGIQWKQSEGKFVPTYPDIPPQAGFEGGKDGTYFLLDDSGTTGDFVTGSNINIPGEWMYRIGSIETGNVVPADLYARDEQIFIPESSVDTCLQSAGVCSPNAECIENEKGYCCMCVTPYYGNGKDCLEPDRAQTLNGRVVGSINGVPLVDDHFMHTYVEIKDGRTHSSISKVPASIAPGLQVLNSIGGIVGWMFALRSGTSSKNGFEYTGGRFNRTARVTFQTDNRTDQVLRIVQNFRGFASPNSIRMETRIDGSMPDIPADAEVKIEDYGEVYEKIGNGAIRSFVQRYYRVNGAPYRYTWDNTIMFEECDDGLPQREPESMRLDVSRTYFNYDPSKLVYRFGMWSRVMEAQDVDPCTTDANNCDANADCERFEDSFRCTCRSGFSGTGATCQDVNECLRSPCDVNARCINTPGNFECQCLPGFSGNGRTCQRDVQLCGNSFCDENARCVFVDDISQPVCQCNNGFQGDGQNCLPLNLKTSCRDADICGDNAQCVYDEILREYSCECMDEFSGDGYTCERVDLGCDACHHYAECNLDPMRNRYTCRCREGYTGDGRTCSPIETCQRCDRYARCVFNEQVSAYQCACTRGFEGDGQTCTRVDCRDYDNLCAEEGGLCWTDPRTNKGICRCNYGYRGDGFRCERLSCDEYNFCDRNAKCVPEGDSYVCRCDEGYSGDGRRCKRAETTCDVTNFCDRNARCVAQGDTHTCQCNDGFYGDGRRCRPTGQTTCDVYNFCDRSARCVPEGDTYVCRCNPGFVGDGRRCRRSEDTSCRVNNFCDRNARCVAEGGNYVCQCNDGYYGDGRRCRRTETTCDVNNFCDRNARCVPEGDTYVCKCNDGFSGDGRRCMQSATAPCDVGSDCNRNARCLPDPNKNNSLACQCKSGFQGDGKQCAPQDQGTTCDVVNDCDRNARCLPDPNNPNVLACKCLPGFQGDGKRCVPENQGTTCDVLNDCDRNARCLPDPNNPNAYACQCLSGFQGDGKRCTRQTQVSCSQVNNCDANADCMYDPDESSYRCVCKRGYDGDGLNCRRRDVIDCRRNVRLCSPNADCARSTDNAYTCVCRPGFRGDGSTCSPVVREGEFLVYAQGNKLMRVSTEARAGDYGEQLAYVKGQLAVGVDTDCDKGHIYWTDAANGVIRRAYMNGSNVEDVLTGLKSPEGIAIDHVAGNMFFTDSELDVLQVAKLDGTSLRTLVDVDMFNPRAIVLDISQGIIYFADWNRLKPQIEKVNMDGTGRQVFVSDNLRLPNGLTFDAYSQLLCWCDAGAKTIECIRTDGAGRRVIYDGASYPFDLTILNNAVFWTDWQRRNIPNVNRSGGEPNEPVPLAIGGHGRVYGITAVRDRCPRARNSCALNNGGCSYLCLPSPNGGRTCVCPDNVDPRICQQ